MIRRNEQRLCQGPRLGLIEFGAARESKSLVLLAFVLDGESDVLEIPMVYIRELLQERDAETGDS